MLAKNTIQPTTEHSYRNLGWLFANKPISPSNLVKRLCAYLAIIDIEISGKPPILVWVQKLNRPIFNL